MGHEVKNLALATDGTKAHVTKWWHHIWHDDETWLCHHTKGRMMTPRQMLRYVTTASSCNNITWWWHAMPLEEAVHCALPASLYCLRDRPMMTRWCHHTNGRVMTSSHQMWLHAIMSSSSDDITWWRNVMPLKEAPHCVLPALLALSPGSAHIFVWATRTPTWKIMTN